jgi:branched-chain amino acid transport system permease protein
MEAVLPLIAGLEVNFASLPQQLINGLVVGSIYALIALGYTMVYGVLRLINFAHGEVFMLGAYTALLTSYSMGFTPEGIKRGFQSDQPLAGTPMTLVIMLLMAMAVCAVIGAIIEFFAYRPMRNQSRTAALITAIGVSLFLQYAGQLFLPSNPPPSIAQEVNPFQQTISHTFSKAELAADGSVIKPAVEVTITQGNITMLITVVVLMAILTYLVLYTKIGRAMRAASHDFDSASLMGVNVNRVVTFTFMLGSALAGAGAMMLATFEGTTLQPFFGVLPGVKAFVAAVLGGIGNIPGAVVGGLVMGFAETLVTWLGFSEYKDAVAFVILIGVLLLKPGGILGSNKVEKV